MRGLRDSKYHVVGELGELLPGRRPGAMPPGGRRTRPGPASGPTAEQLLEVAVHAAAALAGRHFQERYPAAAPRRRLGPPRQMARRLRWKVLNGPRTRRLLRNGQPSPGRYGG